MLLETAAFLGHVRFGQGVEVVLKNTDAVRNCPIPLTPTNIRSFLGLSRYYRRFIDGFSSIASPLKYLTQKRGETLLVGSL